MLLRHLFFPEYNTLTTVMRSIVSFEYQLVLHYGFLNNFTWTEEMSLLCFWSSRFDICRHLDYSGQLNCQDWFCFLRRKVALMRTRRITPLTEMASTRAGISDLPYDGDTPPIKKGIVPPCNTRFFHLPAQKPAIWSNNVWDSQEAKFKTTNLLLACEENP